MSSGKQLKQPSTAGGQSLLGKILSATEETAWQKNEVMTIMHWLKQIIAIGTGIVAGLVPLEGLFGVVLFLGSMAVIPMAFARSVLRIDEEDFGGVQELLLEGATFASGLFALLWIFVYNSAHVQ